MEVYLANAGRQFPTNIPQLVGQGEDRYAAIGWQRRDCEIRQLGNKAHEGRVAFVLNPIRASVEPNDGVPTTVCGQIPSQHQESVGGLVRPIQEAEHPDPWMKDVARSWSPHLIDHVLK